MYDYLRQALCTQHCSVKLYYCIIFTGESTFMNTYAALDYWDLIWPPVLLIYFIIKYPYTGELNQIITNSLMWQKQERREM